MSFIPYPRGDRFKDVNGSFVLSSVNVLTMADTLRRPKGSAIAVSVSFSFWTLVSLAPIALNLRVPLVHMPVCAVYTKHRRMCAQRSRGANDAHCRPSEEPAIARTRLFID